MSENLYLACPHCSATNRLPSDRLNQHPKCGRCRKSLFDGHPLQLGADNFEAQLKGNSIPLLVDFWADWCGPCKMMAPAFAQAAQLLEPEFRLAKLNTDREADISTRYAIRSIPTLVLFHGGVERARIAGAMSANEIVRWAKTHQEK